MYCSTCGTPIGPGLSFCNRCGASLKERSTTGSTATISAYLTAVTVLGVIGLGIMLGGSLVLKKEAQLESDLVGIFMLFTVLIVGTIEFMLLRQLSKLVSSREEQRFISPPAQHVHEIRPASAGALGEPVGSVTDNTTRTLEYASRD